MSAAILIVRRFVAMAVDLTCLSVIFISVAFAYGLFGPDWTALSTLIFALIFVAYFAVLEKLKGGATIGKWIVGISRRSTASGAASLYQSTLRATLLLVIPAALPAIVELLLFFPETSAMLDIVLATSSLWFGLALWPITVLLTGGRSSAFDVLAGTEVHADSAKDQLYSRSPGAWMYSRALMVFVVVAVALVWLAASLVRVPRSIDMTAVETRGSTTAIPVLSSDVYPLRLVNYYSLVKRDPQIQVRLLSPQHDSLTFDETILGSLQPSQIPHPDFPIKLRVDVLALVTEKGLNSEDFHQVFESATLTSTNQFMPKAFQGSAIVVFHYVLNTNLHVFCVSWIYRKVALLEYNEEGISVHWIREPPERDRSQLIMGFGLTNDPLLAHRTGGLTYMDLWP